MKKLLTAFLCASLLFVVMPALKAADCCNTNSNNGCSTDCNNSTNNGCRSCTSVYIPRSVGDNLVRQATYKNYVYGEDCFRGNFSVEYRHQQSRKSCDIAASLFGRSTLHFQGSNITAASTPARDANALIADNFGLSPATDAFISFAPKIKYDIVDFELYFGLDQWYEGLFFQLNLPLAHAKFSLHPGAGSASSVNTNVNGNCCSTSCSTDCNNSCNNSCSTGAIPVPDQTPFRAGCVNTIPTLGAAANPFPPATVAPAASFFGPQGALSGNFLFGDMQTPWIAGRFVNCGLDETKLASVNMILGYNFWECPDYNFGVFIRAAAPTGTEENCCAVRNVFSPQIGDRHWKLGGGITGHYELYNCDDEHMVNVYFEGYIEHLFKRCQVRSFDFRGKGCLSRYMLLKEFNPASTPANQYFSAAAGNTNGSGLINGINFTTRRISTSFDVQGEGQIEFIYSNNCGFSAGLGWNIYGRSDEKGCNVGAPCDATLANREFGFKGCADVSGVCFATTTDGTTTITSTPGATGTGTTVVATASTQSDATIFACGTTDHVGPVTTALGTSVCLSTCDSRFNPAPIVTTAVVNNLTATTVAIGGVTEPLLLTSVLNGAPDPVILTAAEIDINSGLLDSYLSNKVFGHLDYAWSDCDWTPNIYVGGEVEFASHAKRGAMNAWGVYVGAGVSF